MPIPYTPDDAPHWGGLIEKRREILKFWKMNGAGNDFVILNNMEEKLPQELFPQLAKTLCERHLSIGADGFMVVEAPTQGDDY